MHEGYPRALYSPASQSAGVPSGEVHSWPGVYKIIHWYAWKIFIFSSSLLRVGKIFDTIMLNLEVSTCI